ncbi:MAG: prepilin-type N-terminal cleavage/methylation domain-containing protein [Dissulfurispiraceae bacterium]
MFTHISQNLGLSSSEHRDLRSINNRGFTLIEVLITFAILSLIITALYSTFFMSKKAVDSVDESLLKFQEARFLMDTLKRELESALYAQDKAYTVFKLDDRDFYGRQTSQLVLTTFSSLLPGLTKIQYTVEENNDNKLVLTKKISSAYSLYPDSKIAELIEDIESFTVEAKYNGRWIKTWDSALSGNLPDEIRFSVSLPAKVGPEKDGGQSIFQLTDIASLKVGKNL